MLGAFRRAAIATTAMVNAPSRTNDPIARDAGRIAKSTAATATTAMIWAIENFSRSRWSILESPWIVVMPVSVATLHPMKRQARASKPGPEATKSTALSMPRLTKTWFSHVPRFPRPSLGAEPQAGLPSDRPMAPNVPGDEGECPDEGLILSRPEIATLDSFHLTRQFRATWHAIA